MLLLKAQWARTATRQLVCPLVSSCKNRIHIAHKIKRSTKAGDCKNRSILPRPTCSQGREGVGWDLGPVL